MSSVTISIERKIIIDFTNRQWNVWWNKLVLNQSTHTVNHFTSLFCVVIVAPISVSPHLAVCEFLFNGPWFDYLSNSRSVLTSDLCWTVNKNATSLTWSDVVITDDKPVQTGSQTCHVLPVCAWRINHNTSCNNKEEGFINIGKEFMRQFIFFFVHKMEQNRNMVTNKSLSDRNGAETARKFGRKCKVNFG